MAQNTYEALGDRAPIPCTLGEAHGVAMAFMNPGTTVTSLPFRHPTLLDNEVRINVTHAGCCHSDIFTSTQSWFPGITYPLVPGHEIVGVVDKVGEKLTKFQPGDRVGFGAMRDCCGCYDSCLQCRTGLENMCPQRVLTYDIHFGGYATSFQAKGGFFHKLYDSFPGQAAPLFCAGLTVFAPLHRDVISGMKVGVVGIGGLGHLALKFANCMGAEVTAISTSNNKQADAREFGAHHFLNLKDEDQMKNSMGSFDYIINTATSYDISQCCSLLRPRGTLTLCGIPNSSESLNFNLFPLLLNQLKVQSSFVGSKLETEEMLEFVKIHNIYPKVEIFEFADTQDAVNSLAYGSPHYPNYRAVLETKSFMEKFHPAN